MSQSGKATWSVVTALAVALSIWSLQPARGGNIGAGCCLPENGACTNFPTETLCIATNGTFTEGAICLDNETCVARELGCCETVSNTCFENFSVADCVVVENGTFVPDAVCVGFNATSSGPGDSGCATVTATATASATATATDTATATPTGTPMIPDGGSCVDPLDCVSGNCVDDVCCDSACLGGGEACNLPGQVGTCSAFPTAPAPAVSNTGMIAALVGLLAIGMFALRLRRRAGL